MKIYLASDHAGFGLKQFLGDHLKDLGHAVEDCGALEMDPLDDYPDFIIPAAKKVAKNPNSKGHYYGWFWTRRSNCGKSYKRSTGGGLL